jgi:hypothetical protein
MFNTFELESITTSLYMLLEEHKRQRKDFKKIAELFNTVKLAAMSARLIEYSEKEQGQSTQFNDKRWSCLEAEEALELLNTKESDNVLCS